MSLRRSNEPIAWSLFGAGGMMLAFLGPACICATLLLGTQDVERARLLYAAVYSWVSHPIGALALLAFIALSLYHTVHRLYHGLHDIHLKLPTVPMLLLFYGGATVLSAITALLLISL